MSATAQQHIKRSLTKSKASVFSCADFACLGNSSQLGHALRAAIDDGTLVRTDAGIYVKTRKPALTENPIFALSQVEVSRPALSKLGVKVSLWRSAQAYANARTPQASWPLSSISGSSA